MAMGRQDARQAACAATIGFRQFHGKQFGDATGRVIRQPAEDIGKSGMRIGIGASLTNRAFRKRMAGAGYVRPGHSMRMVLYYCAAPRRG